MSHSLRLTAADQDQLERRTGAAILYNHRRRSAPQKKAQFYVDLCIE